MEPSHSQTPRLTRRALLGTVAGAVAAVAGLPLLLGEPPAASAAADFQLRAPEPNPKYGGVLRYGITSTPPHFDIHQSGTVNNMGTQGCMYDNLIRRNPRWRRPKRSWSRTRRCSRWPGRRSTTPGTTTLRGTIPTTTLACSTWYASTPSG